LSKLKVMIAEDHETLNLTLIRWLGRSFDVVAAVKDGRSLVDGAILLNPDLIVSDVSMPLLTGIQALEELTARGYHIPFVFVTAEPVPIMRGTWSVVDKEDIVSELEAAVLSTASGGVYISHTAYLKKDFQPQQTE